MACKKPYHGRLAIEGPGGRVEASTVTLHPRGCMGARQEHLDVALPRDPCGILEYLSRGGGVRARAFRVGDCLEVDLTRVLGVYCRVEVCPPPRWGSRAYIMLSRSGKVYMAVD